MRVVCWNIEGGRKPATWAHMLSLEPDVILAQEALLPNTMLSDIHQLSDFQIIFGAAPKKVGREQRWGTAILAKRDILLQQAHITSSTRPWVAETLTRLKGVCVAADMQVAQETSRLVSVHSPAWPIPLGKAIGESDLRDARLEAYRGTRTIWGADLVWRWLADEVQPRPCIVGGDLNASILFDRTWGRGNEETLRRFANLGLVECVGRFHPDAEVTPTYMTVKGGEIKHQIDYLWATPGISDRVTACMVPPTEFFLQRLSRHLPIVLEIAL